MKADVFKLLKCNLKKKSFAYPVSSQLARTSETPCPVPSPWCGGSDRTLRDTWTVPGPPCLHSSDVLFLPGRRPHEGETGTDDKRETGTGIVRPTGPVLLGPCTCRRIGT